MKIIAFIQDPQEIKGLLSSLHLPDFHPPRPLMGPSSAEPVLEPVFDDSDIVVQ